MQGNTTTNTPTTFTDSGGGLLQGNGQLSTDQSAASLAHSSMLLKQMLGISNPTEQDPQVQPGQSPQNAPQATKSTKPAKAQPVKAEDIQTQISDTEDRLMKEIAELKKSLGPKDQQTELDDLRKELNNIING